MERPRASRLGHRSLPLLKPLLIAVWNDLSGVRIAEAKFHYTPKYGSRLNMAEFSVLDR